jgi:VIT1/CCC1 family predicted Fe2+/Mn2+ transporter
MSSAAVRTASSPRLRSLPSPAETGPRRAPKPLGVVAQVRVALRRKNRLATFLGAALGGFVPVASYVLAHHEVDASVPLYCQLASYLVAGGLVYSALSVYGWATRAFGSGAKAAGFVVLLEGTLVSSHTYWLGYAALVYLVAVNGVAAGCRLANEREVRS